VYYSVFKYFVYCVNGVNDCRLFSESIESLKKEPLQNNVSFANMTSESSSIYIRM